jgi:hypothetical protein
MAIGAKHGRRSDETKPGEEKQNDETSMRIDGDWKSMGAAERLARRCWRPEEEPELHWRAGATDKSSRSAAAWGNDKGRAVQTEANETIANQTCSRFDASSIVRQRLVSSPHVQGQF